MGISTHFYVKVLPDVVDYNENTLSLLRQGEVE